MRNTKLGTKRQCQACGARFYDLGKRPAVCAKCGAEVDLNRLAKRRAPAGRPEAEAVAAPSKVRTPTPAAPKAPPPSRQWSNEQSSALDKVGQWLKAGEPQVFRLFGY